MPSSTSAAISRRAVSWEHFASFAHFDVVSFPSKPSRSRLSTRCCRSLSRKSPTDCPSIRTREDAPAVGSHICRPVKKIAYCPPGVLLKPKPQVSSGEGGHPRPNGVRPCSSCPATGSLISSLCLRSGSFFVGFAQNFAGSQLFRWAPALLHLFYPMKQMCPLGALVLQCANIVK